MTTRQDFEEANGDYHYIRIRPDKFESKTGTALKPLPAYARSTFESACELRENKPYYVYLREDLSVGRAPIRDLAHAKALPTMDGIFLVFVEDGKITIMKDNRPSHWKPFKFEKKSDWSSPINKRLVASEAARILRDLANPMEFLKGLQPPENKTAGGWFGDRPTHITVPAKKGEAAFTVEDRKAIAGKELDKLVEARVAVRQWVKF